MNDTIQMIAVYTLPVLFAITLHEAAHAYAARYFGDLTAYSQGRMSLNPSKHIDPIGTIVLPLVTAFVFPFVIGYARPVPVDFSRLNNPKKDMLWVALAGPAANLLMAFAWPAFYLILYASGVKEQFFFKVAAAGMNVNLALFAFNLFPLPPFDGGRIVFSLLPDRYAFRFSQLEPYGFAIFLALVLFSLIHIDLLNYWMHPVISAAEAFLSILLSPLKLLLT